MDSAHDGDVPNQAARASEGAVCIDGTSTLPLLDEAPIVAIQEDFLQSSVDHTSMSSDKQNTAGSSPDATQSAVDASSSSGEETNANSRHHESQPAASHQDDEDAEVELEVMTHHVGMPQSNAEVLSDLMTPDGGSSTATADSTVSSDESAGLAGADAATVTAAADAADVAAEAGGVAASAADVVADAAHVAAAAFTAAALDSPLATEAAASTSDFATSPADIWTTVGGTTPDTSEAVAPADILPTSGATADICNVVADRSLATSPAFARPQNPVRLVLLWLVSILATVIGGVAAFMCADVSWTAARTGQLPTLCGSLPGTAKLPGASIAPLGGSICSGGDALDLLRRCVHLLPRGLHFRCL